MWHANQNIRYLYITNGARVAYAIFSGLTGWHRVDPTSSDGVTNVVSLLSSARSAGKKVNVFIGPDNTITRALMV